jgi:4'-phosphopantetheinyl transferase EntD
VNSFAEIMPPDVAAAEMIDDHVGRLFPEEEEAIRSAVADRRNEFTSGRICARAAMAKLGYGPVAVPRGPQREPIWPHGLVGSITHCRGYRGAAVARSDLYHGIGIDAEPHAALPDGVIDRVSLPEERRWLGAHANMGVHWDRVLFSAKESIYKAWFPVMRRWLGFEDVVVQIDPQVGRFAVLFLVPGPDGRPISQLMGRFRVANGLVMTFAGFHARCDGPSEITA